MTAFSGPNDLSQWLVMAWAGSLAGATFDVEISAVPLPAGLLLIITAFAGLAIVGRRRRETAAV